MYVEDEDEEVKLGRSTQEQSFTSEFSAITKKKQEKADLRKVFTEKYGVTMEFPAFYQEHGKIVPNQTDYVVSTAFHIIPKAYTATVQTTYLDGQYDECNFDELCENVGKSIIIRLTKSCGRHGFHTLREVQLEQVRKCLIQFSTTGKFFGIFLQQDNILNIFSSRNLTKLFDDIEA